MGYIYMHNLFKKYAADVVPRGETAKNPKSYTKSKLKNFWSYLISLKQKNYIIAPTGSNCTFHFPLFKKLIF